MFVMAISRRELLAGATAIGIGASPLSSASSLLASGKRKRLRIVHITDLHIQPEAGAIDGVNLAVQKILALRPRPDLIICGGDHIMDGLMAGYGRAEMQFDLFREAMKPLEIPVVSVIGNHDIFGWGNKGQHADDPMYGKGMIAEKVLRDSFYRSFDLGGYHFVLLDSIQPGRVSSWRAVIDDDQLSWLQNDLASVGTTPTVVVTHVPILTAFTQYTGGTLCRPSSLMITANGREVQKILCKHNVKAVLQGHTHVLESIHYMHTRYITGGSICGNWWRGPQLGVHPEGFLVCDLNDEDFKPKYAPYGWKARAPRTAPKPLIAQS
jgi:Icc protein